MREITEINELIKIGGPEGSFMSTFSRNDDGMCKRFFDPGPGGIYTGGMDVGGSINSNDDTPTSMPVGQTTGLTADLLIKVAAVAINDPDYHVVARTPIQDEQGGMSLQNDTEAAQICRQFLRDEWDKKNCIRVAKKALLKRYVSGLGCVRYYWAENGVKWDHVQSWDLAVDPFLTDWQNLEWAAVKIKMSLRTAAKRYPKSQFAQRARTSTKSSIDTEPVDVWIFWDKEQEAHVADSKLLNTGKDERVNRYGSVPLLFLEGDLHPGRSVFPLGDMLLAAGAEAECADLTGLISTTAKNGGPINFYDPTGMEQGAIDKLKNGGPQDFIPVKGLEAITRPPILRTPSEEISSTALEALRRAENYRDGIIGIGEYDRGVAENSPKFATEVYASMSRGGARKNQAQSEYEIFMDRWAKITVSLTKEFGGAYEKDGNKVSTPEQESLWEALQKVTEVHVLEGSTIYRDPTQDQQSSLQLATMTSQAYPLMLNLAQIGLMKRLPDLEKIYNKVYTAFGINETEQMWVDAPQMPQQQGKSPIETLAYKDAPEDVKRQIEQQAGLQPSQMGGVGNGDTQDTQEPETESLLPHAVDLEKQKRDHQFQLHSQVLKQIHEIGLKQQELNSQQQIAANQAQTSMQAAKLNNQTKLRSTQLTTKARANGKRTGSGK